MRRLAAMVRSGTAVAKARVGALHRVDDGVLGAGDVYEWGGGEAHVSPLWGLDWVGRGRIALWRTSPASKAGNIPAAAGQARIPRASNHVGGTA